MAIYKHLKLGVCLYLLAATRTEEYRNRKQSSVCVCMYLEDWSKAMVRNTC